MAKRSKRVREPIQVYLTSAERAGLDRVALELGVSRAEVLRRGLEAMAEGRGRSFYAAFEALIGTERAPDAPTNLAEQHDEYLAQDLEKRSRRSRSRSS